MMKLSDRAQLLALFAIVTLATAFGSLSQTAVNSMLEAINAQLGLTSAVSQWLTTSYMLVVGVTVPVVTYLSARFSTKQLALISLGVFLAGSSICLVAPSFGVLVSGRVLQGVAAGITMPLLQAIAITKFPPQQVPVAMGVAGIALGFAPNIGPAIGGALVGAFGWRSFFVLLIAVTLVMIACVLLLIRGNDLAKRPAVLDVLSVLLSTVAFGGMLLGFSNAASLSFVSPLVWLPLILGVACLVLFLRRQSRIEHPLINLAIFESANFRASFWAQNFLFGSFMGITLIVPLFWMGACGGSPLESGLLFVPATISALFVNPLAGVLCAKLGARRVTIGAGVLLVIGATSMCFLTESAPFWLVAGTQLIRSMGVSASIGPWNSWGMIELPREIAMDGSSFTTAVRQAFGSMGTAIMMLLVVLVGSAAVGSPALCYQLAFAFSAVCSMAVLAIAIWKVK